MRSALRAALPLAMLLLASSPGRAVEQADIDRAIDRGVAALKAMQQADGTWPYNEIGATALAGLTLLECKVPADDPAVKKSADALRRASLQLTHTYSLSLAIMFFDRLGDPRDVPLIESMTVRLLAGQTATGGWSYTCPPISNTEIQRLTALLRQRNELRGSRTLPRVKPGKRTVRDLPQEIQQQLALIPRIGAAPGISGDNSNTQFATLALWVARRHGLPVERALQRIEARYRLSQAADGGWSYLSAPPGPGAPMLMPSSAAMTCAGLLGLAVAHGARDRHNAGKDPVLNRGLRALGTAIGHPVGRAGAIPVLGPMQGRAYYFFWSLERVAVALDLKTIGKKDWYTWGAEIILANQQLDGSWSGEYSRSGADTCFALLFLRRANLASDLTARLTGSIKDPGQAELRAGGVGGAGLVGRKGLRAALAPERRGDSPSDGRARQARDKLRPIPAAPENARASRLSAALVEAEETDRERLLKELRDRKGVDYTEALALAIPRLQGEARKRARDALAARFTRLTAKSLANYLEDVDPEIRRAAILASAMLDLRSHIPAILERLNDGEPGVVQAARAALKTMTKQDFGPAVDATAEEHRKAIARWKAWWRDQEGK